MASHPVLVRWPDRARDEIVVKAWPVPLRLIKGYDPGELRDEHGRWTAGAERLRAEWHMLKDDIDSLLTEGERENYSIGDPRNLELRRAVQAKRDRIAEIAATGVEF